MFQLLKNGMFTLMEDLINTRASVTYTMSDKEAASRQQQVMLAHMLNRQVAEKRDDGPGIFGGAAEADVASKNGKESEIARIEHAIAHN